MQRTCKHLFQFHFQFQAQCSVGRQDHFRQRATNRMHSCSCKRGEQKKTIELQSPWHSGNAFEYCQNREWKENRFHVQFTNRPTPSRTRQTRAHEIKSYVECDDVAQCRAKNSLCKVSNHVRPIKRMRQCFLFLSEPVPEPVSPPLLHALFSPSDYYRRVNVKFAFAFYNYSQRIWALGRQQPPITSINGEFNFT